MIHWNVSSFTEPLVIVSIMVHPRIMKNDFPKVYEDTVCKENNSLLFSSGFKRLPAKKNTTIITFNDHDVHVERNPYIDNHYVFQEYLHCYLES